MKVWTRRLLITALAVAIVAAGAIVLLRSPTREPELEAPEITTMDGDEGPEPTREPVDTSKNNTVVDTPAAPATSSLRSETYVVRPGDTLYSIAETAYIGIDGTSEQQWLAIYDYNARNDLINPGHDPIRRINDRFVVRISVGQVLLIPFYPDGFPPAEEILARYRIVDDASPGTEPRQTIATPSTERVSPLALERTLYGTGPQLTRAEDMTTEPVFVPPPIDIALPFENPPAIGTRQRVPMEEAEPTPREPAPTPPAGVVAPDEERPPSPPVADETPPPLPTIALTSPAPASFFGDTLLIEGSVEANADGLESLVVYFEGNDTEPEEIYLDSTTDRFRYFFSTIGVTGHQVLVIEARNDRGGEASVSIPVYDGNTPPEITLTRPDSEYGYGAFLEIAGRAVDPTVDAGQPQGVAAIEYELLPADFALRQDPVEGEIIPSADGLFSVVLPTEQLNGVQLVTITPRGVNGAEGEYVFEIAPANTAIPRVDASAGNGRVTVDWTPLPGERRYSIWYTEATPDAVSSTDQPLPDLWGIPAAIEVADVSPPFRLTGLENERRYRIQIVGSAPNARRDFDPRTPDVWSEIVENVPLEGTELTPTAENDFDAIALRWQKIDAIDRYAIWRRDSATGEYQPVATTTEPQYRDQSVRYGVRYSYRIAADLPGAVLSRAVAGQAASVPQEAVTEIAQTSDGAVTSVAVAGAYVAFADTGGVAILDIWDAPPVIRRGRLDQLARITKLASWDRYLFGVDDSGRIRVIDADDPAMPRLLYTSDRLGAIDIAVVPTEADPLVIVAGGSRGLGIYRFTQSPVALQPLRNDPGMRGEIVSAIRDPANGSLVRAAAVNGNRVELFSLNAAGTVQSTGDVELSTVTDLDLIAPADGSSLLLATTSSDLAIVAPQSGNDATIIGRTAITGATAVRGASYEDGSIFGYVGTRDNGLTVFDLSDPATPIQFARTHEQRSINELTLHRAITGEITVVAATDQGTAIYEAHTIGRSRSVATIVTPGRAESIRIAETPSGSMAVIADTGGAAVHPVAEALRLRTGEAEPAQYFSIPGTAQSSAAVSGVDILTVNGRPLLLIADRARGLSVFDLGRGDSAPPVSTLTADIEPIDLIINRDGNALVYLLDERWGLIVVDLSVPEQPRQRGSARLEEPRGFVRLGDRIYVADADDGIVTIDISNPDLPRQIERLSLPGARAIDLRTRLEGTTIGLVATPSGAVVLTSSAGSEALQLRGEYSSLFIESVAIGDRYALVSEGVMGLSVLDLSNPDRPRRISSSDINYASRSVAVDDWALVTDGTDLQIVEIIVPPWLSYATETR